MADDRIQLNLVLNEATVSAVEGRVRNLVNRLNNQNISLNINGRNLDNIVNRLNDIQHRMQTINSTPVNINANLTSVQQQYRLETERMRVAQQLELSRQRTLQTENQAISALAQQNRTLTVNNNVTHQIEQGAQNIGHNMNVAGGHARDFVDYLVDGVRYIVVYRSLYEIMNQIGEAFSEMKNVDKELISVRKTTGMAENEIEKIRKASYGVATEYGRTASEYLGSVSEFARGGYKELSTELAKVSLLTQNVGDVSADSANKMLLSVDAAYKLNGNVTELTNVVNGLNNIANLNPTSMQKMADGMQVSASMAKVAGLEISDLVALIGTGTAVTQREGSEIARAIRTILMNIRAQNGELEDGTVIDDESIAKAEAALKGVGIATKEFVNGVRELRNPMDILDELAGKWSTLNTEAQSVVLESLANKRQANVLAAILENYEMVGKMQSEYFNSANSAIKENELYLQGWEATQKRVSAKWTEFIANMADTAVITGSLNALYGVLIALDSPIGRIATSIVLVNTALAVSSRLWQAIRARSIVADILSMSVAERDLGTAIQLVTGHLGRQIAQWAMSPFGMATIAVAGIALITSAIESYKQKLKEAAQEASNQAEESAKAVSSLLDLKTQLSEGTKSSDELTSAFKEQLKAMGYTEKQIDALISKYGGLSGAMDEAARKALEKARTDAHTDVATSSKMLEDSANGGLTTDILITDYGTGNANLDKQIEEILSKVATKSAEQGSAWIANDHSAEGLYAYYSSLQEVVQLIQQTASETNDSSLLDLGNAFNTTTYGEITEAIGKLSEAADLYGDAISRLHNADAQLELADYLKTNSINSKESFDNYINGIKNSTEYSDEYKLVLIDVANNAFPQFSNAADAAGENLNKMTASLEDVTKTLSTLQGKYNELKSAQDEYNSTGAISADTMQKLVDNDLLQYLDYSSGKLQINTDALLAEGEAAKVSAIQNLQKAMSSDLAAVAAGRDAEASTLAQKAIAGLGDNAETAGNQAGAAAAQLAGFAVAADTAKKAAEGNLGENVTLEDFQAKADAIIAAYTNAAETIGKITIKSPQSSGSSKSSTAKKAEDEAKKAAEEARKAEEERIRKELDQLKAGLEEREKLLSKYKESVDLTDYGLDLAEENDFALRVDLLNNKMSQLTMYGQAMREEFDRVANIIPETGDQADALVSHLETLGSDMRENVKTIRETQIAMQKLKVESISSIGDTYLDDMNRELSNIEKRIELLNKDNKKDYEYTNQILQMEMFLPSSSSASRSKRSRSNADRDIISKEQATQDVLNDMFKKQIEKNENLREEERQALLSDMETMRNDMALNISAATTQYDNYGKDISKMTDSLTDYVTKTINGMSLVVPKPDTSNFQKAASEIKVALNEINDLLGETPGKSQGEGGSIGSVVAGRLNGLSGGAKGVGAVAFARTMLGTPYVWGGTNKNGVDCSGLTYLAYQKMGVDIGRTTYSQYANTARISKDQLQPGDLVFSRFGADGKSGPAHVGMYIGNGRTIESPRTGDVVKYGSINKWEQFGRPFYASGTPRGNVLACSYGIAGENFKPEILIDKATGETKYIDKPTIIDLTKTDVVGEKQTANMPKFATGTISPMEIAAYIRRNYPEITNAGIAAILGNIEQESSFNPKAKTIEAYGSGSNRQIARWGLFQLDDERIKGWSDIVNNAPWQRQIDAMLGEGRYQNSGMGSLSKYNVWKNVLTNANLSAGDAAKMFDSLYERSDGKSSTKRAANAEKYFQQLSDNTSAIRSNTEAIQDIDLNRTKIGEIQGYVDEAADKIDKSLSSTRLNQIGITADDSLSPREKTYQLFEVYEPTAKNTAKTGTELWTTLYNEFVDWFSKTESGEEIYSQEIFDQYVDGLDELKDKVVETEEDLVNLKDTIICYLDEDLSKLDQYIDDRNFFNDWVLYGDTQIKAIQRQIDDVVETYERGVLSVTEYNNRIKQYEKDLYSAYRDDLTNSLNDQLSKLGSFRTLLQRQFDITNSIADAQHEIDKELATSKAMYEWVNEDTRKLLFNQEDYNALTEELTSIQARSYQLQKQYNAEISGATSENLDAITSKYEAQYDVLMKSYEIKKADLEILKKQQQLNNVLKERNVSMFINGAWRWVANTQDVINAQNELSEAQYQKSQAQTSLTQTQEMGRLTLAENSLTTTINNIENGIVDFDSEVDDITKSLNKIRVNGLPELRGVLGDASKAILDFVEDIKNAKIQTPISYSDDLDYSGEMQNHAYSSSGNSYLNSQRNKKSESEWLGYDKFNHVDGSNYDPVGDAYNKINYMQRILDAASRGDVDTALRENRHRNDKIDYIGGDQSSKLTDMGVKNLVANKMKAYGIGTGNALPGMSLLSEKQPETLITKYGELIPVMQPSLMNMRGGEMVFNPEQMSNVRKLWDLANGNILQYSKYMRKSQPQSIDKSVDNSVNINGMKVDTNNSREFVEALRRFVNIH